MAKRHVNGRMKKLTRKDKLKKRARDERTGRLERRENRKKVIPGTDVHPT